MDFDFLDDVSVGTKNNFIEEAEALKNLFKSSVDKDSGAYAEDSYDNDFDVIIAKGENKMKVKIEAVLDRNLKDWIKIPVGSSPGSDGVNIFNSSADLYAFFNFNYSKTFYLIRRNDLVKFYEKKVKDMKSRIAISSDFALVERFGYMFKKNLKNNENEFDIFLYVDITEFLSQFKKIEWGMSNSHAFNPSKIINNRYTEKR